MTPPRSLRLPRPRSRSNPAALGPVSKSARNTHGHRRKILQHTCAWCYNLSQGMRVNTLERERTTQSSWCQQAKGPGNERFDMQMEARRRAGSESTCTARARKGKSQPISLATHFLSHCPPHTRHRVVKSRLTQCSPTHQLPPTPQPLPPNPPTPHFSCGPFPCRTTRSPRTPRRQSARRRLVPPRGVFEIDRPCPAVARRRPTK